MKKRKETTALNNHIPYAVNQFRYLLLFSRILTLMKCYTYPTMK